MDLILHLWLKFITFRVSRIITLIVKKLLHLWLVVSYIYGCSLLHLWSVLHLWLIFITFMVSITFIVVITFMGDTALTELGLRSFF